MELDYKEMFENLQRMVGSIFEREERYFELLRKVNELTPFCNKAAKVVMEMPIADQISILEPLVVYCETCKMVLEKHELDDDIEIEEME